LRESVSGYNFRYLRGNHMMPRPYRTERLVASSKIWTRRRLLTTLPAVITVPAISEGFAAPIPSDGISAALESYMKAFDVPALSFAFRAANGAPYNRALGYIVRSPAVSAETDSLFRIASLSKSITSVAIFTLIQRGTLNLDSQVFGADGCLRQYKIPNNDDSYRAITVHHLLTHTSGGWSSGKEDPMFRHTHLDPSSFAQKTIDTYPLRSRPGEAFAYSNFGYFLLGKILEESTGMPYGAYVQQNVLAPLDISDMRLASHTRLAQEAEYYGQGGEQPQKVPIELHDSCGGWLASAMDLSRFSACILGSDQRPGQQQLLLPQFVKAMLRGSTANPRYACGWWVGKHGDIHNSGGLPGSTAFMVHTSTGSDWAILANTRQPRSNMERELHKLSWELALSLSGGGRQSVPDDGDIEDNDRS
jgi:CubicO group peptidase (beta-lactamase class C family)